MCTEYDEKNKLWGNLGDTSSDDSEMPLGRMILNLASTHGNKVAQINHDSGVRTTYHEVWLRTIRAAQNLLKRGFKPRQIFGFMADSSDHLISILSASFCLACPVLPLHPLLSKQEKVRILAKTKPSVIFCDASSYYELNEALEELKSNVKVFIFGEHIDNVESVEELLIETGEENSFEPISYDMENDIMGIFCSSGTTGPAKCVSVPYSRKWALINPTVHVAESVFLTFDPIYWTVGVRPIIDSIYSGATRIITAKPFSAEFQLKLIEKYKVNILYNAAFSVLACIKSDLITTTDLSSVKQIRFYGSKIPVGLIAQTNHYFPNAHIESWYGTTEVGIISISNPTAQNENGCKLFTGCLVKIVDSDGHRCGLNTNGEICVKKEEKFLGYFDDPEITAATIDEEGFIRTGDVGYFDENGILFIVDRLKYMIKLFYFTAMMIPGEVEEHLMTLPDIEDVCVVGIPITCGTSLPAAVVVRKSNSTLNQRDVFNVVAEHFPHRSKLRGGVYFVDSIPRSNNGKVIQKEVTKLATKRFQAIKESDPDIQSFLSDLPTDFRKLI